MINVTGWSRICRQVRILNCIMHGERTMINDKQKSWNMMKNRRERENYSWELIQDIIDKEVSSAFKLKEKK